MHQLTSIVFCLAALLSCNSQEKEPGESTPKKEDVKKLSPVNCYRFANGNDTIEMKMIHVGQAITGTLVYKLKEKDRNMGTIQGAMNKDIFVADYTFMSEGRMSVRPVAFKLDSTGLTEGYGTTVIKNEKTVFSDLSTLTYDPAFKLTAVACE